MATSVTVNLNDADEAGIVLMAAEFNRENRTTPGFTPVTPAQLLRTHVREWIAQQVGRIRDERRARRLEALLAAPEDVEASVDALLDPYVPADQ